MIKRYYSNRDTTITNAFSGVGTRTLEDTNMGESDALEVFYIAPFDTYNEQYSRVLMGFPVSEILNERIAGDLPAAGSVRFWLKVFNSEHPHTVPRNFRLKFQAISLDWYEGIGLGMNDDRNEHPANWNDANQGVPWVTPGGDTHPLPVFTQSFDRGLEHVEVDITDLVEEWLDSTKADNGLMISMDDAFEAGVISYFTKRFYSRSSEFILRRPFLEARWDSQTTDDRGSVDVGNTLCPDNSTLILENRCKGVLTDIPSPPVNLEIHPTPESVTAVVTAPVVQIGTGTYSSSLAVPSDPLLVENIAYDRWLDGSGDVVSENKVCLNFSHEPIRKEVDHEISMKLKSSYRKRATPRLRVKIKDGGWDFNVYSSASTEHSDLSYIKTAHWSLFRETDDFVIVDYDLEDNSTLMSYDKDGHFFDFDMGYLYEDFKYYFRIGVLENGDIVSSPKKFHFRIEREEG